MSDEGIRDWELLDQYTQKGSQEAFAQIVERYVDLVYTTCFRDLRDHHLAEDSTQAVFLVLAQKARSLRREVVLAGWLFQTARLVVRNARKQEARRKIRERKAAEMIQPTSPTALAWEGMSPLLSDGLERLNKKDRDAILLHYYQRKTLAEVGGSMGVSEDAARMRVSRAVEKLRSFFRRKGQTMALGAVATLLMANAVQAAPPACGPAVVAAVCGTAGKAALAGGAAAALARATMHALWMAKLKTAAAVAAVTLLVPTAGLATYHAVAAQREHDRRTLAANAPANDEILPAPAPAPAAPPAAGQPAPCGPRARRRSIRPAKAAARCRQAGCAGRPAPLPHRGRPAGGLRPCDSGRRQAGAHSAARSPGGDNPHARTPTSLEVENNRTAAGGEIRTRIMYQPGTAMQIQRTIKPRSGKEYAVILQQGRAGETAAKAGQGQTTLRVTADGGENWKSWTAETFPRFVENYPLAFFAHLAPVLRDFYAQPVRGPRGRGTQGPDRSQGPRERPTLAEVLSHDDAGSAAVVWSRETEMLNRDAGFLVDCLDSDDLDVRVAALKRLNEVTGKAVSFERQRPARKTKSRSRRAPPRNRRSERWTVGWDQIA